jgi:hypothetical protein
MRDVMNEIHRIKERMIPETDDAVFTFFSREK